MKHYIPFALMIGTGIGIYFGYLIHQDECLFTYQNRCYTCQDENVFFVGTPENCTICSQRQAQYTDWDGKSIWACLNTSNLEDENIEFPEKIFDIPCPKAKPLRDILGHCYDCNTKEPVQILNNGKNICPGKRYLTRYRKSEKSNLCPSIHQIKNPYVCTACHGKWQNEKCTLISFTTPNFCQKNSDCKTEQWCYPFPYSVYSKSGICRPIDKSKWISSGIEGYTYESAEIFCTKQNAHLPSFSELEKEKDLVLSNFPNTNIWAIFDEGSIYLDSLKKHFPITKEKDSIELGGDNTYALCIKN